MERRINCPVCRAPVPLVDPVPESGQQCPYCRTTFVLPPASREAEAGADDGDVSDDDIA